MWTLVVCINYQVSHARSCKSSRQNVRLFLPPFDGGGCSSWIAAAVAAVHVRGAAAEQRQQGQPRRRRHQQELLRRPTSQPLQLLTMMNVRLRIHFVFSIIYKSLIVRKFDSHPVLWNALNSCQPNASSLPNFL